MKHQRQAGFIRNYSSKQFTPFQQEPSEFSYFRPRPLDDERDQFSPYKMEETEVPKNKPPIRPPLPQRGSQQRPAVQLKAQGDRIYNRLKQRMSSYEQRKDKSKQKLESDLGYIRTNIEQIQNAIQDLQVNRQGSKHSSQKIKERFAAELQNSSSAPSSSSESEEVIINTIPSPKLSIEKYKQTHKHQSNIGQLSSTNSKNRKEMNIRPNSASQQENIITFNSRVSNHPPIQIKSYSSSSSEEGIEQKQQEVYLQGKKRQTLKGAEENERAETKLVKKEPYQNKGGICFDIDTKQFSDPVILPRQERPVKKASKMDKKSDILRRRETAKAYDKMARKALFTAYH